MQHYFLSQAETITLSNILSFLTYIHTHSMRVRRGSFVDRSVMFSEGRYIHQLTCLPHNELRSRIFNLQVHLGGWVIKS